MSCLGCGNKGKNYTKKEISQELEIAEKAVLNALVQLINDYGIVNIPVTYQYGEVENV